MTDGRVLVDTSAFYGLLVGNDPVHSEAARIFRRLRDELVPLFTTSYVLVETYALLGRRIGIAAATRFADDIQPLVETVWVDAELHHAALGRWLRSDQRQLSLVDCVSFEALTRARATEVFAFDGHFEAAGFRCVSARE